MARIEVVALIMETTEKKRTQSSSLNEIEQKLENFALIFFYIHFTNHKLIDGFL